MKKLFLLVAVCCLFVSANAFAASPIRMVGFEAGYVSLDSDALDGADGTWMAGAFLDFGLPATNLYISPFMNYWNSSTEVQVFSANDEYSVRDFQIGANLKYTIPTSSLKFQPFIAGGIAANVLSEELESLGASVDEGETRIGFQMGAGFNVGISESANIVTSGWYNIVEDVNHWQIRAGLGWRM